MPSAARNGFFTGLALVVLLTILYLAGTGTSSGLNNLSYLILAISLFLSARNFRDQLHGGFISYGRTLGYSVLVSLFAAILPAFFTFVLYKYIDTGAYEQLMLEMEEQYDQMGMTEQQIEMAMKGSNPLFMAFGIVFGYTLVGFIFSLIISIFVKRERSGHSSFDKDTL